RPSRGIVAHRPRNKRRTLLKPCAGAAGQVVRSAALANSEKGRDDSFELLGRAPNASLAGLWASLLESNGIQAHVPDRFLADQWATTQGMTGNVATEVFVPRSRLEEARRIIEKHPLPDENEAEKGPRGPRGRSSDSPFGSTGVETGGGPGPG